MKILSRSTVATGCTVIGIAGLLAISTAAVSSATPAGATSDASAPNAASWSKSLSLLGQPRTATDATPLGTTDLFVASTSRLISTNADATYYAALNNENKVCLIAVLPSGEAQPLVGVTCGSAADFTAHGVGIQIVTKQTAVRAYLVPDGTSTSSMARSLKAASSAGAPASNLVLVDPYASEALQPQTLSVNVGSGTPSVTLRPFEAPDPSELN